MSQPQSTASRVFNLATELERDIALVNANAMRGAGPRAPLPPMPDYVEHRAGVTEVGRLSAEAMVREFESAAKEVNAMGAELQDAAKRCEAMVAEAHAAIAECKETAAAIREKGKLYFVEIQQCTLMTAEVRSTCNALKQKIAGPGSA